MIIKNISKKIVNIGAAVVMPDEQIVVPEHLAETPSIMCLERMNILALIPQTAVLAEKAVKKDVEEDSVEEVKPAAKKRKKKTAVEEVPEVTEKVVEEAE